MRTNEPVTQREFDFPQDATLMSTTDAQSHLTYANEAFVAVSGFTRDELQGQPHNIVRHPDMPAEAFADMWATLRVGEPWSALVKNRRQNGDHYWVRANAIPVVRDGQQTGYMSVRTKPSRDEVAAAEAFYRALREGRTGSRLLHKGIVIHRGLRALLSWHKTIGIRPRIRLNVALMWLLTLVVGWLVEDHLKDFVVLCGGTAVVSGLLCWILERQIASPIELLRQTALDVATGAARQAAAMDRIDEIGTANRAIGQLGLMFRWLIDDVRQQAMSVKTAATEIAQGNDDLSRRTETAAASVQSTASSMAQMTDSVQASANTASHANQLSASARDAAQQGSHAVEQVVSTMQGISASSKRIGDIIGTIDGIAFQTNILALNAAVEAARAGEQGRGFAVVAGEVRSLASRSADAAREIKSLIGSSVERVEAGSRLVDDAGRSMTDIMAQVQRTTDLIGEISTVTQAQTRGIAQASSAIAHLDEITQQNAALVEQSAAASSSLQLQAERLAEAVSVFR